GCRASEAIRMPLTATLIEARLQIIGIDGKARLQTQRVKILHAYAVNDVPQPQLFLALGFSNTKPEWMRESFQSSVMPLRYTKLLGSIYTFTSSNCRTVSVGRGF